MMNYLFAAFMIIGVVAGGITGTMDAVLRAAEHLRFCPDRR